MTRTPARKLASVDDEVFQGNEERLIHLFNEGYIMLNSSAGTYICSCPFCPEQIGKQGSAVLKKRLAVHILEKHAHPQLERDPSKRAIWTFLFCSCAALGWGSPRCAGGKLFILVTENRARLEKFYDYLDLFRRWLPVSLAGDLSTADSIEALMFPLHFAPPNGVYSIEDALVDYENLQRGKKKSPSLEPPVSATRSRFSEVETKSVSSKDDEVKVPDTPQLKDHSVSPNERRVTRRSNKRPAESNESSLSITVPLKRNRHSDLSLPDATDSTRKSRSGSGVTTPREARSVDDEKVTEGSSGTEMLSNAMVLANTLIKRNMELDGKLALLEDSLEAERKRVRDLTSQYASQKAIAKEQEIRNMELSRKVEDLQNQKAEIQMQLERSIRQKCDLESMLRDADRRNH